jgi:transcriptional regulator with XRE-family HTH domain
MPKAKTTTKGRSASGTDQFAGARIRQARVMAQMSQTELGAKLGVSFQQVQKYEKGVNRISGSRLVQIAEILGKPMTWFYDEPSTVAARKEDEIVTKFLSSASGLDLARNFLSITQRARNQLVELSEILPKQAA